jgi:hypothetical protein
MWFVIMCLLGVAVWYVGESVRRVKLGKVIGVKHIVIEGY